MADALTFEVVSHDWRHSKTLVLKKHSSVGFVCICVWDWVSHDFSELYNTLAKKLEDSISCYNLISFNTTLMAKSEEELKRFLMKVKEESEKDGLKLNMQKTKIMA